MSVGKVASQAAHATAYAMSCCNQEELNTWEQSSKRTIIVFEARDEQHMLNIQQYCFDREVMLFEVIDEGVNEIKPFTITAMSSLIMDREDEHTQQIMSTFKLYRDTVKVTLEIEK